MKTFKVKPDDVFFVLGCGFLIAISGFFAWLIV